MNKMTLDGDKLQSGPVMERSCTDPICCLIFVAFIAGMAATAAYGFAKGDPKLLMTGWDADARGCGYSEATKDYPYLYWPAPNLNINTSSKDPAEYMKIFKYSTCVKSCPSGDNTTKVQCLQPLKFSTDQPNSFFDCVYYPMGRVNGNKGPSIRYKTV